jgi:hypothetical protein
MIIRVGFVMSEAQTSIKSLNTQTKEVTSITIDSPLIRGEALNLLLFQNADAVSNLASLFQDEEKFYPIIDGTSLEIDQATFDAMIYDQVIATYIRINTRWILSRNIETIESIYPTINYLKDLWVNDRNAFFEELWFIVKTNLGTSNLNIIFNDLKEPTEKQKEKGDKNKLCHSFVKGEKLPQIFDGTEVESKLMQDYDREFGEAFNITEYNAEEGNLVFCTNIEKSPILVMANLNTFNQLQRSVLIAIFSGLQ